MFRILCFFLLISQVLFGKALKWEKSHEGFYLQVVSSAEAISADSALEVDVEVSFPSSYRLDDSLLIKSLSEDHPLIVEGFNLAHSSIQPPQVSNSQYVSQKMHLVFQPTRSGQLSLGSALFCFHPLSGGKTVVFAAEPFIIEVKGDARANAAAVEPEGIMSFWFLAKGLFITVFIGGGVYYLMRKRRMRVRRGFSSVKKAQAVLKKMDDVQELERREVDEFYKHVDSALRTCLARDFDLQVKGKTTEEIVAEIGASGLIPAQFKDVLEKIMRRADAAKFGVAHISKAECREVLKQVKELTMSKRMAFRLQKPAQTDANT